MHKTLVAKALACVLVLTTGVLGMPQTVLAAPIQTQALLQVDQRQARIDRIDAALAREEVRQAMLHYGVAPAQVEARVGALSDQELAMLEQHLDELPAGGDGILVILGIAFLVLVILDLVGVTNVFTGIKK